MNTFNYNLSETEYLTFQTHLNVLEVYSGHDGAQTKTKIATYRTGKWEFDSYQQQKLFWFLFGIYKQEFGKAFKMYIRTLKEKPQMYEFNCIRRRFSIKVTKLKRGWNNWFYGLYPQRKW